MRCNKCHRPMKGTTGHDGACACGGLIEADPPKPDVEVIDHGTIFTFLAKSSKGKAWIEQNVQVEDWARVGKHNFHADHRPARDIIEGMRAAGLVVQ